MYCIKRKKDLEMASARNAIAEVARREQKTVEEVRADMEEAMLAGYNSPDPKVRAVWAQIPCEGEMPTPEELIIWASKRCRTEGRYEC